VSTIRVIPEGVINIQQLYFQYNNERL